MLPTTLGMEGAGKIVETGRAGPIFAARDLP
jgi:hypothetical protein